MILTLGMGTAMSIVVATWVARWEQRLLQAEFDILASARAAALQRELDVSEEITGSLAAFYAGSESVKREEFHAFAAGILKRHPEIQALEWLPRVTHRERLRFETAARREGIGDFQIRELDDTGRLVPAASRPEYVPVCYVEPHTANQRILGFDIASDPVRAAALQVARDSGKAHASAPIHLIQSGDRRQGTLIIYPVYQKHRKLDTIEARRRYLIGYVVGAFYIPVLIDHASAVLTEADIQIVLYDLSNGSPQPFLAHPESAPVGLPKYLDDLSPQSIGLSLHWRTALQLPGRQWLMVALPGPDYLEHHPNWRAIVTLVAGLLLSLMLAWYLHRHDRHTREMGRLVNTLGRRNAELDQEVRQREAAQAHMRRLSSALEQTADSIIITDPNGYIEYVNPAFEAITGYAQEDAIGRKPNLIKSGQHDQAFYAKLWGTILRGEVYRDVLVNRKKDGSLYYEEKTISPLKDNEGRVTHFVSAGKDITDRMQAQERLHYLAYHDMLTGLPNRALFQERLGQSLLRRREPNERLAILFLDLDRFKQINDTLGHDLGDSLLKALVDRLRTRLRKGDTFARLGGDEFAVLLETVHSIADVAHIAQEIINAIAEPFHTRGYELFVTTSIGISIFPDDAQDAGSLLRQADVAMYRAKDQTGNSYEFYSSDMGAQTAERWQLETNLRRALDHDEFQVWYQPQVDLGRREIVGVEALIRWRHPELGLIPPLKFIYLLEETGLIITVGAWVLRTACAQVELWRRKYGVPLRLAVNLSGRQFYTPGLSTSVEETLKETGLSAHALELEITESVLMQTDAVTQTNIEALRELGVRFALDDFGTGYSSLSYLTRFHIDTLKIDRSFIRDVPEDPYDTAIVTAILTMAHRLHIEVIAEGVETSEQHEFLRREKCSGMQGYLFAAPMPADDMAQLLSQRKTAQR